MSNHAITGHKVDKWQYLIPLIFVVVGTFMIPFSPTTNGFIAYTSIWALLYAPMRRQLAIIMSWPAFWFALAFIALMLIRLHNDLDLGTTAKLKQVKHYVALLIPVFFLVPLFSSNSLRRPIRWAVALSGIVLASVYCLHQYLPNPTINSIFDKLPAQQAAIFLAIAAYILYAMTHDKRHSRKVRTGSAICVFYIGLILFTLHSAYVGLTLYIIGLLFFTYQHYTLKQCLYLLLIILAAGFTTSIVYHDWLSSNRIQAFNNFHNYIENIKKEQGDPTSSASKRIFLTHKGLSYIGNKPIFGYGTGSFRNLGNAGKPFGSIYGSLENNYLQIAAQLGIVGLALFILFLFQIWRMSKHLSGIEKNILQGTLVLCILGALYFPLFATNMISMLFAVLMASCLGQRLEKH